MKVRFYNNIIDLMLILSLVAVLVGIVSKLLFNCFGIAFYHFMFDANGKLLDSTYYTTTIFAYDSDQNMVKYETMHGTENREWVDYDDMTQYTKDAVVAVEDERFWKHHGVDWKSTTFAFANMFLGLSKNDRGGSTITQQLIKNI